MRQPVRKELHMEVIKLKGDYIKLGQALKAANLVDSGVVAKLVVQDGLVTVNGEVEVQRGKNWWMEMLFPLKGRQSKS